MAEEESRVPSAEVSENLQLIRTARGQQKLCWLGFTYYVNKKAETVTYWDCEKRRTPGGASHCKGRLISEVVRGKITARVTASHNHEPNALRIEVAKFRTALVDRSTESNEAPEKIIRHVSSSIPAVIQASISRPAQRKVVQRSRSEGTPAEPTSYEDIDERYTKTLDGERFLQANFVAPGGRVLILATTKSLRLLSKARIWLMDGTFQTAPQGFYQLFTIHASVGDGPLRRFVPLIYMLLPKKDEATYVSVFEELIEIATRSEIEFEPELLMTDFELAQINAAKKVFEGVTIHGCYFHLCQNMFKKLQQLGFQRDYGGNYRLQLLFKQITALAFVPVDEIPAAFDELKSISSNMMPNFFQYVSDYYVHGKNLSKRKRRLPTFPPELWCVNKNVKDKAPRTSNNLEGWHTKWNGLLKSGNPPFYSVIKQFQIEERSVNAEVLRVLQGTPVAKRAKKTVDYEARIFEMVVNYNP